MDTVPVEFLIAMNDASEGFDEPDIDGLPPDPLQLFIEKQAIAVAGASAGVAALEKLAAPNLRDETNVYGNPWITHAKVESQPVESRYEIVEGDAADLMKRFTPSKDLTFKARVDEHGNIWCDGFDASGEKKYSKLVEESNE